MAESEHETVLDRFGPKRLRRFREFHVDAPGVSARCAVKPSVYSTAFVDPLPGCCEFATGLVSEGSQGRTCCVDGCYCSPAVFKDPKVFGDCSTRLEQLAKEQT
ncbi:MAG: hypothetical protein NWF00_04805 [Candidatus Bathyarchaeota archaeon]|nr:hypothetical protein [Candidatus Bathyarchaeota archaeon]